MLWNAYGTECDRVRQDLAIAGSQLRDYQARLGKPFTHDAYLTELTGLRDLLKAGLSASSHHQDKAEGPTASELAEQIKALKAANSIEATPQRTRQKHSTAEEPIAARIRRRTEEAPVSGPVIEPTATPDAKASLSPDSSQNSFGKPPLTFQERIAMERQRNDREPILS